MPLSEILALSKHVEQLGIIGVLVLACCVMGYAVKYFRSENLRLYGQLDRLKTAFIIVKQAADSAGVKYDLDAARDLLDLLGEKTP